MARIKAIRIGSKVIPIPHPFEEEVQLLIEATHRLLCEAIIERQNKWISECSNTIQDSDELGAEIALANDEAHELRTAANSMALVTLVTRFQHAIRAFAEDVLKTSTANTGLVKNLQLINTKVGDGPVPVAFFEGLETVRDSIIHADSKAEWMRGKTKRCVPNQYRDSSSEWVHLTAPQLDEAIKNSVAQIRWYDHHL